MPIPPLSIGQYPPGCAEQQPDPLEEAAATAISHQSAPPSAGQRAHPLLRPAAGEPSFLHPCLPTHTAHAVPSRRWGTGVHLVACGSCSLPPFNWLSVPRHSLPSGPLILLPWFLDLPFHLPLSVLLLPGPSTSGLQDSCLCLQCTFSDPCGCKRGAGCTVWDPVKTVVLGQLFSSLHPASPGPSLTMA